MDTNETLKAIEEELRASYFIKDIKKMTFEDFFNEVDTDNAYEELWDSEHYKPYYFIVFNKIKKGEIQ